MRNGAIDGAMWHDLLRTFIGVKQLHFGNRLLEVFPRVLRADEAGSDPEFLPNLRFIRAAGNLFTSFIDTRKVVGRPVQFVQR